MFTGVGGFELGIGELGECIGFSETDKWASQLLSNRFPNVKNYGDARTCDFQSLDSFDLLCGGFPCQAFSIAGNRRGFEDTRGTLFFSIAEALKIKRPKLVLLENVKGLLNHNKGETFKVIIQTLEELGYDVQWMVLNSKFFGVPQNRERVFIIGNLRGTTRPEILPFRTINSETIRQENTERPSDTITATYWKGGKGTHIQYARTDKSQHSRVYDTDGISPTLAGASKLSGDCTPKIIAFRGRNPENPTDRTVGSPTEQRAEPNSEGISNSLSSVQKDNMVLIQSHSPRSGNPEKGGTGLLESSEHCFTIDRTPHIVNKIRRLTPIECERLQGFPDGWTEGFSDTQRYKMMGNAVTVNVIKAIAEKLLINK